MKKTLLTIAVVLSGMAASAQIEFGPKIGFNLSSQSFAEGSEDYNGDDQKAPWKADGASKSILPGLQIGGFANITLTESLSLRPELLFSQKGIKMKMDDFGSITNRVNYLEIPIGISYGLPLGENKLDFFAGPYFAFALGGKSTFTADSDLFEDSDNSIKPGKEDPTDFEDENTYVNPLDIGLNLGAGFKVNKFYISANYGFGFINTTAKLTEYPDDVSYSDFQKFRNTNINLSVSYLFGGE